MKPLNLIASIVMITLFMISNAEGKDIDSKRYDFTSGVKLVEETSMFVIGNGPIKATLFVDPDCPYCHRVFLNMNSSAVKNYTIYVVPFLLTFKEHSMDKYRWIFAVNSEKERLKRFLAISKGDTSWEKFKPTAEDIEKTNFIIKKGLYTADRMKVHGVPAFYENSIRESSFHEGNIDNILVRDQRFPVYDLSLEELK